MKISHKREWNLATYDSMDDPEDMIKLDREKETLYDFTYIWNLKKQMNKLNKQKQSYWHRAQTGVYQKRGDWGEGKK